MFKCGRFFDVPWVGEWGVRLSKAADDPEEFLRPLWCRTTIAHNNGGKKMANKTSLAAERLTPKIGRSINA